MISQYARTEMILGREALQKIRNAHVAVFGAGGVGGNAIEALARMGVGRIDIIDSDTIRLTNLNRQLLAVRSTLGMLKTDAAEQRIHDIDPEIKVRKFNVFYLPEKKDLFDFTQYDYIIDAVDTVTAKLDIIEEAQRCNTPVISCMGTGNRLDPLKVTVTDLYSTENDALARIMRRECRKRGIRKLKVVYSSETALKPCADWKELLEEEDSQRRSVPGSTSFVPCAAGIAAASAVIRDILEEKI